MTTVTGNAEEHTLEQRVRDLELDVGYLAGVLLAVSGKPIELVGYPPREWPALEMELREGRKG